LAAGFVQSLEAENRALEGVHCVNTFHAIEQRMAAAISLFSRDGLDGNIQ